MGLWAGDGGKGAKYWLHALTEVRTAGWVMCASWTAAAALEALAAFAAAWEPAVAKLLAATDPTGATVADLPRAEHVALRRRRQAVVPRLLLGRTTPGTTSTAPSRTANLLVRGAPRGTRTPNRQIRRRLISVEAVGSGRSCPAQVAGGVGRAGSRRSAPDRPDDHRDDHASVGVTAGL